MSKAIKHDALCAALAARAKSTDVEAFASNLTRDEYRAILASGASVREFWRKHSAGG